MTDTFGTAKCLSLTEMSMLSRVNKGSKERQAHTLGVHSKKGVHLIEVSVKR